MSLCGNGLLQGSIPPAPATISCCIVYLHGKILRGPTFRKIREVLAPQRFFDSLNLTTPLIVATKIKGPIGVPKGRFKPNRTMAAA